MAALFGKKKEDVKDVTETAVTPDTNARAEKTGAAVIDGHEDLARVLSQPRITEKATFGTDQSVYVFNVVKSANKKQIKEAVKLVYNVDPIKVNITTITRKKVRNARTGMKGVKGGGKKAYVYLKKGDSISIM